MRRQDTNVSLEDEAILNENEDGEEEEINLLSDHEFEQSDRSNKSTTKIKLLLEEPSTRKLETRPTHLKYAH